MSNTSLPVSAVPALTVCSGCVGLVLGLTIWLIFEPSPIWGMVVMILATALPMWCLELRRFPRDSAEAIAIPLSTRIQWRMRGLLTASAVWGASLGLFQVAGISAMGSFWDTVFDLWFLLVVGALVYFLKPATPYARSLEALGCWLMQRPKVGPFPWSILRDQLVKAFFLPLMISFAYGWLVGTNSTTMGGPLNWYLIPLAFLYLIDTIFGTIGYLSTSYRMQAHIRSSDPTFAGWAVALVCYPPFFLWIGSIGIFNYRDGLEWHHWLGTHGIVAYCWGAVILLLSAIYAWATVVFGIRFSNLTNRGIITSGPFRYSKHPAYISKNLSWWLISVPFLSSAGTWTAVAHCGALLVVNSIYWARAKTEERHLMSDADYRAYAHWIAEHGAMAKLRRRLALRRYAVAR